MEGPFRQTWWQENLPARLEEFKAWVGDSNAPTKVAVREHVMAAGHRSLLDCGCGLCVDYDAYRAAGYEIAYHGLDYTPFFVESACARGIHVAQGSIESIPFPDASFDVVYARHVLEHLPHYRDALSETVRVAKREVVFVFFLKPKEDEDIIDFNQELNLFHNTYDRRAINVMLSTMPRVDTWQWIDLSDAECLLSITVA